jgi:hypothetical protein
MFIRSGAVVACLLAGLAGPVWAESNVLFIFDASGSMKKEIDGKSRIAVAKEAFGNTVLRMPQTARTGLMVFGAQRAKDCSDIALVSPIGAQPPAQLMLSIAGVEAKGETPIAEAVRQGAEVLRQFPDAKNSIVLLTDGIEECQGDPCAAAEAVKGLGVDLKINIVGFTLDSKQRAAIECMSNATGGQYYDAANADALVKALTEVAQTVVETPPPPAPPAEKPRKIIFTEEFDAAELSPDIWEIGNPSPDNYLLEKGNLISIATTTSGFENPQAPNKFQLKQALPDGDYAINVKFAVKFATGRESVTIGLFEDEQNYLAARIVTADLVGGSNFGEIAVEIAKLSKGQYTGFSSAVFSTRSTIGAVPLKDFTDAANAVAQPITLKLIRHDREYRASANFEGQKDDQGKPIWVTTDAVSSLRPPKLLMLTTSQTTASSGGESTFFVDSVTIDVPGE